MSLTAEMLARIAIDAGALIMNVYREDFDVDHKDDMSPVTKADKLAEGLILEALRKADPDLPIIAEEAASDGHIPEHDNRFALVDPLDGTREFVNKNGQFTVNIAIIEYGKPVMGVVYAPALDRLFVAESPFSAWQVDVAPGDELPAPALRRDLSIRAAPEAGLTAIASKSHRSPGTNTFLESQNVAEIIAAGSSLKFCLIAAGEADLYPRHGRTMEWDTAAGHAVAQAAGARVTLLDGTELSYGKTERGYDNPFFIVWGDVSVTPS